MFSTSGRQQVGLMRVLEYIGKHDFVRWQDLQYEFGYTKGGASTMLHKLKHRYYIISDKPGGIYSISERGIDKLMYLGRWNSNSKKHR